MVKNVDRIMHVNEFCKNIKKDRTLCAEEIGNSVK